MFALPLLGGGAWMEAMVHANSINLLTAGLEVMVHAGDRQRGAHPVRSVARWEVDLLEMARAGSL